MSSPVAIHINCRALVAVGALVSSLRVRRVERGNREPQLRRSPGQALESRKLVNQNQDPDVTP
ncbi:MAG: hypothetical protein J2P21_10420 [Chloracidobacterium sp.]|nr:hypothetical protein [Chloracidobacterium sp.]